MKTLFVIATLSVAAQAVYLKATLGVSEEDVIHLEAPAEVLVEEQPDVKEGENEEKDDQEVEENNTEENHATGGEDEPPTEEGGDEPKDETKDEEPPTEEGGDEPKDEAEVVE